MVDFLIFNDLTWRCEKERKKEKKRAKILSTLNLQTNYC